jgi:hypothetical protein
MTRLHLSNEDMNINSALTTHDALINLGQQMGKTTAENTSRNNRIQELEEKIGNFPSKLKTRSFSKKQANSWDKIDINYYESDQMDSYISMVNELMKFKNDDILLYNKRVEDFIRETQELKEEKDELNNEHLELQTQFDRKNKYWEDRVRNLREKCIRKNKIIKAIYLSIMFIISQSLLINYIGIHQYVNILYFSVYYTLYYSVYAPYYLYKSTLLLFNTNNYQIENLSNYIFHTSIIVSTAIPCIMASKYMKLQVFQNICLSGLIPFMYMMIYHNNDTQIMALIVTINGLLFHISQNRIIELVDILSNLIMIIYANYYTNYQPDTLYCSSFAILMFCLNAYIKPNNKNTEAIYHVVGIQSPLAYALYMYSS